MMEGMERDFRGGERDTGREEKKNVRARRRRSSWSLEERVGGMEFTMPRRREASSTALKRVAQIIWDYWGAGGWFMFRTGV